LSLTQLLHKKLVGVYNNATLIKIPLMLLWMEFVRQVFFHFDQRGVIVDANQLFVQKLR
jgi:hypothetical protein